MHAIRQLELPLGLADEGCRPGTKKGLSRSRADRAVDAIRKRFGDKAVDYMGLQGGVGAPSLTSSDALLKESCEQTAHSDKAYWGRALYSKEHPMELLTSVARWSRHENACGEAFVEEVEQGPASPALRGELVRFVDGAYTKWHYHTGEQLLLATAGEGFVECQDRPMVTIGEGARVFIPSGVWHRHGALGTSTLVHLAVTYGVTRWAEDDQCLPPSSTAPHVGLSVEREIAYLNQRLLEAEEAGQTTDLEPLLAESFFIVPSNGEKVDRDTFLGRVPANANRGRTASELRVDLVGECAIATSVVATKTNPDGTPAPGRFWNTRLFIREKGQWRCVQWQVARIPEARGLHL